MWVKLDDGFTEHIKLERAGPLAGWLHVCALCYCARQLSDGRIPKSKALRLADVPKPSALAAKLVEVGLWEEDGEDYVVHDYHDWNPTAAEEIDKRRKRAEAGRKGGLKSRPPASRGEANGEANASANAQADAKAEVEADGKRNGTPSPSPSPYPLEESSQRSRTSARRRTDGTDLELDSSEGTADERAAFAIDWLADQRTDAASGVRNKDRYRLKVADEMRVEHWARALANARRGWTPRDIAAAIENPKHIPQTRRAS